VWKRLTSGGDRGGTLPFKGGEEKGGDGWAETSLKSDCLGNRAFFKRSDPSRTEKKSLIPAASKSRRFEGRYSEKVQMKNARQHDPIEFSMGEKRGGGMNTEKQATSRGTSRKEPGEKKRSIRRWTQINRREAEGGPRYLPPVAIKDRQGEGEGA